MQISRLFLIIGVCLFLSVFSTVGEATFFTSFWGAPTHTYPYNNGYLYDYGQYGNSYGNYGYGGYNSVPFGYYEVPYDPDEAMSPFLADHVFSFYGQQPLATYNLQQQQMVYGFLGQQSCMFCP